MDISNFAKYFWHTVKTREPVCVGKAITRWFYLDDLSQAGKDRSQLSLLSNDELRKIWDELPIPQDYNPEPTPYVIGACYAYFTQGIADYGATKFLATLTELHGFDRNDQVVYTPEPILYKNTYIDYVRPMYVIGIADEVIRPYISEFRWDGQSTMIGFNLDEGQIQEFQRITHQLRDETKNSQRTTTDEGS